MTTIRDIAKKAGVGVGTVSRVLNNNPRVSEKTRARVLQVIEDLGYKPNPVARRLSQGKTLIISVIIPFFTRPGFSERLNGVVSELSQSKYNLLIHTIQTPEQRRTLSKEFPNQRFIDGALILSLPPLDEEIETLANADIPIVLIDSENPNLSMLHQVIVDDVAGGKAATEYLLSLGHRRIGFIGDVIDNPFHFTSSRDRYYGYREALQAAGITLRDTYYAEGEHGRLEAREIAMRMLTIPERPTAIFAASDTQAVGVLEAARQLELRVPEDLSVIGYDDIELAEIMNLTTMHQKLFESGRLGVELLLKALENPDTAPIHETLPVELTVRGSTAPPSSTP